MELSVIIVNYNVKHFLEQCLHSVQKAVTGIKAEIIVVDNNSSDGSLLYLPPLFPNVKYIANEENRGFSKACNQGLQQAAGRYILFLNPDTIVPEDCFKKCMTFLDADVKAGAAGIKMLDGSGKFLKESKRAFPSPLTSLFKLFGLSKLFPKSKLFSTYHLGHLDENSTNEVDVLAGAFMMIKKEVLDKTGGFDETFFMYGEDVDLSYRIQKAGYKNFYFAGSSIIHFKGESTRKASMNYVRMFYKAMNIFVKKHYSGSRAGFFIFFIHLAIWLRAGMTAITGFIRRIGLPVIDAGIILLAFWLMKNLWSGYIRSGIQYEYKLLWIAFPAYTLFFLIAAYYAGLYDRWYKRSELIHSILIATILLLAAYSLLPEQYRFSRGIIVFGSLLSLVFISLLRWVLVRGAVLSSSKDKSAHTNTLIAGSLQEYERVLQLLNVAGQQERVLGRIAVTENDETATGYWNKLPSVYRSVPFREIIFCEGTLSFSEIIEAFKTLPKNIIAKIYSEHSNSMVGSNLSYTPGEAVSKENGYKLNDPYNRRLKRLIDVGVSIFALVSFPLHVFIVKKPFYFFANCFSVLLAKKTWIGYAQEEKALPVLRPAVIACNGLPVAGGQKISKEGIQMMDYWYARDYELITDLKMIIKTYRNLGS